MGSKYNSMFKKALAFKRPRKLLVSQIALLIALLISDIPQSGCSVAAKSARATFLQVPQIMNASMLSGTFQAVGVGPGDQVNPHVDCNLASYANDDFFGRSTIRYFDFSTNTDHAVPGNGLDWLSDVSGNRIVFTELSQSGEQIVVFDTASQTRTVIPGGRRSAPTLGGILAAFEDRSFSTNLNESVG